MSDSTRGHGGFRILVLLVLIAAGAALGGYVGMIRRPAPVPTPTSAPASVPLSSVAANPPAEAKPIPQTPQVWVIAIGINEYRDEPVPDCHGAARDAHAIGDWFLETGGWEPRNVLFLDDRGQTHHGKPDDPLTDLLPTRENLDWVFREWLPVRLRPRDVIVVYFAGHALAVHRAADAPASQPDERAYLLPIDARLSQVEKSGWAFEEAIDDLAAAGRNPIVCWLDTSLYGRGRQVDLAQGFHPSASLLLQRLVRWPGVTAWIAADGHPAAEAPSVLEHSPFAAALLRGLGTPKRPQNLAACLNQLNHDADLAHQGFRILGGVSPSLNLWSSSIQLASRLGRELLLQRGHAGGITSIAFSADGIRMITGAQDSTIKIWNATDRSVLRALNYHMVGVTSIALSPNGEFLASGDGSGWLRVWNLLQNHEVALIQHDRGVDRLAFLPDGEHLVSLDLDGKGWLWSVEDLSRPIEPIVQSATALAWATRSGPVGFVWAEGDGKIVWHAPDGRRGGVLDGPGDSVTSRRLVTDGRLIATSSAGGNVVVWEAATGREILRRDFEGPIDALGLSSVGTLAVASRRKVSPVVLGGESPKFGPALDVPGPLNQLDFSHDGRWLAACTAAGSLHVWLQDNAGTFGAFELESVQPAGLTTTVAFSPDGRRIVSGDQDGGLRTWVIPANHQRPSILPRRGQIAALSVSGDGRYLLQVTQDRQAQIWDLQEGRALANIAGRWITGVLTPDASTVILISETNGEIAALDRSSGRYAGVSFERPKANPGDATAPSPERWGRLAVSDDGRWIVAGSETGGLACVWDAKTGKPASTIQGHDKLYRISSVGFSPDARHVLTASEDGTAKLWDISTVAARALATFAMTDVQTSDPIPVTAAALTRTSETNPGDSPTYRVVTGGINGQLFLWEPGQDKPIDLGSLDRAVLAASITRDGRWLAVAGASKSVWLYEMSRPRQRLRLDPTPQHAEQVNALVAWPNNVLLASGSDDATIRLWGIAERKLLGTLSAEQGTTDWVAYTPDGLFDSSVGGEKQVTWLDNNEVLPLEQFYDSFHVYKLTDQLRQGIPPKAPAFPEAAPPRLSIDAPPERIAPDRRARLTVSLGEPKLANVRLYQNGVPVQSGEDFNLAQGQRRVVAEVALRHGLNRFYVMAGRDGPNEIEGRSEVVELRYDGPDSPPQMHVLAVGVSQYENPKERSLQFADHDARELSQTLQQQNERLGAGPGLRLVLTNNEVSKANVESAFRKIRDRVKGRPEDTVVVFLAGHAEVLDRFFCLLLPKFPFGADVGPNRLPRLGEVDGEDGGALPYAALYRNIARLNALQRLVVIDACQAEAIADDLGVRQIEELIDHSAQRAKTAYLLAARRGEPASEAAALKHGLMTYALLRGMGRTDLEKVPGLTFLDETLNADRDGDRRITTDELRWYADQVVPQLASRFPLLVQRTGASGQTETICPTANLGQNPRIQSAGASFPLIELPPAPTDSRRAQREAGNEGALWGAHGLPALRLGENVLSVGDGP